MTATNGDTGELAFGINVAPMIDVLLVLLIIFMVIVPAVPRGEAALAPHSLLKAAPGNDAVVLEVIKRGDNAIEFRINRQQSRAGGVTVASRCHLRKPRTTRLVHQGR
jgi:biopolymer transport protein ExbD